MIVALIFFILILAFVSFLYFKEVKEHKAIAQAYEATKLKLQEQVLEKTTAQVELKSFKESTEQTKEQNKLSEQSFIDIFQSLASKTLQKNNEQFLQLANQRLNLANQKSASELDKKNQAIQELVQPLKISLDKYQSYISDIEKERQRSYANVELELKKVMESNLNLSQVTTNLKSALKKPHVRGQWGELQLKNCMELAGMSEYCDVSYQDSTNVNESRLIPDMTVRMPGGRLVVVDAKTPIEAFLEALETQDEEEKRECMERHGRHVKTHVQQLSKKDYGSHLKKSADFTVMFLPNESFLYAALESQPGIIEYALDKKIIIATPPTLIGFLKVIRFGWNEERLAESAEKISEAGKELHRRVATFTQTFELIGKALGKASEAFEKGKRSLESRVLVQAKKLENLGAKSEKSFADSLTAAEDQPLSAVSEPIKAKSIEVNRESVK